MDNQEVSQTQDTTQDNSQPAESAATPVQVDPAAAQAAETVNKTGAVTKPAEAAAIAAFTPNFKYKALKEEKEIPAFLHGAIKDKQSQEFIHSVFSKAEAAEHFKGKFHETRQNLESVSQNHNYVMGQIQDAQAAYKKGDLDTVFEVFRVDPEKVLQWAVKQVQLSQMPPEQRQAFEAQRFAEKRAAELEKTNQFSQAEISQQQGQLINQMLDLVLERPDYQAAAQAYDARRGQSGAFRALVVQTGKTEFLLSQKTLSPLEAAQKALELIGGPPAPMAQGGAPQNPASQATDPKINKPTLPNLNAAGAKGNASPGKSKMKSLDDLKRKYDEIVAR